MLLVLELADIDLSTFLDGMPRPLAPPLAKCIMQHILRGLAACHAHGAIADGTVVCITIKTPIGILHRDLKPSNVLAVHGRWKLGDFGQSRPEPEAGAPGRMSADVCTRWYRAPELLYGSRAYGTAVDMWAAGCIFAELLGASFMLLASTCALPAGCGPVFQGNSDIDQLVTIMQQLGTINEARWPGCSALPDYDKLLFNEMPPKPWEARLPGADPQAVSLLQQLLCYPPCAHLCVPCMSTSHVAQRRAYLRPRRCSTPTLRVRPVSWRCSSECSMWWVWWGLSARKHKFKRVTFVF